MFFLYLVEFIISKKPVIVLPPLYGTNLWISYNKTDANWYCPESVDNELLWVNPKWVVPPMYNCLCQYMQVFWDDENHKFKNRVNTTITIHNFGGEESVRYVVPEIFGYSFIESFASIIDEFKKNGYTIGQDLFAAPYDWRIAPVGLDDYWPMLQKLVEEAYEKNGKQKVTMFGFSCGGHALQQFLGEHCQDQTWKDTYIERAVFLAPSFGGVGQSFFALWSKVFPIIPIVKGKELSDMIESMPVVLGHLPNHVIFDDEPIVRSQDDVDYTAAQLRDLLVEHKKVTGDNIKILDHCQEKLAKRPLAPIGVPAYIVFNSGIQTEAKAHFKKGWNKPPKALPLSGDGTVLSNGIMYACKNWTTDKWPVRCVDVYRDHELFEHQALALNPYIHSFVFNKTQSGWFKKKGRKITKAPYVVVKNNTYVVREDIRKKKILNLDPNY